jgi:tetratricopeptide (TPR) repeat protein
MGDPSRYRIIERLGKGGMGEVFLAEDTQLERKVAVKFLSDELHADPVARQRFEREAKSAAALDHPYICKIHEMSEIAGRPCIVMEHVSGRTLDRVLSDGPLPPSRVMEIATEVVEALMEAHARRILHRDLKPANLMLTDQGHVKVMDFGLAKRLREPGMPHSQVPTRDTLTSVGAWVGTPTYMAPEQVLGEDADARSDIFAFGVVLYELLAGIHPFRRSTSTGTLGAILHDPPTPPPDSTKRSDYTIFDKLLAKERRDRYQSFREVLAELRRLRDETSEWMAVQGDVLADAQAPLGPRRTPYVGRERETAELHACLDRAIRGRGGIVLIGGEPGVGKTRLVEQVQGVARQRKCLALTGRCYEMEGAPPFIPFVELVEQYMQIAPAPLLREALGDASAEVARLVPDLRRMFPDIPPPLELPPEQQRRYLFKNVAEFLFRVSRQSCIVFLLDDLQWADGATLSLLQHLAPQLGTFPVLILGTYRDVELDVQRPFAQTLEALNRKRLATRLNLERLSVDGVRAMLTGLGGPDPPARLVRSIYQETEGNPFFVEEVFQHLKEEGALFGDAGTWRTDLDVQELEVPEGVRLVIGRRLERLSPESYKVLTFGAVVGRSFSLNLLEAIGEVTGDGLLDALEESERARLIVPTPGREPRWEFSHALIRQTLTGSLSLPRRQRLHLKVADAIERAAGDAPEKHASDLAHHLYQAGTAADARKTVRYMRIAGERGLEAGAGEAALRQFEHALELVDDEELAERAALLSHKARALSIVGRTDEALDVWCEAASVYDRVGNVEGYCQIAWPVAMQAIWRAEYHRAGKVLTRGLEIVGEEASPNRCRLLAATGSALANDGNCEAAPSRLREAIEMAEQLGDARLLAEVLDMELVSNWAFLTGRNWAEQGRRFQQLVQSSTDPWMWADAMGMWKVGLVFAGQLRNAADLQESEDVATRVGHLGAKLCLRISRDLRVFVQTGDIDEFKRFAEWYRDSCQSVDYPWDFVAYGHLGLCQFWRGDWENASENFERALRRATERQSAYHAWGNYFMVLSYAGDRRAAELFESRRQTLPQDRPTNTCGSWVALMRGVEGLAVAGRRDEAAALHPLTVRAIDTGTLVEFFSTTMPHLSAGIAAACGEQWDAAEDHYRTGLHHAHALPHRMLQPELRRWYARMLVDRNGPGDHDKARTLLGEAIEMYHTIGMPRHVDMAKDLAKTF